MGCSTPNSGNLRAIAVTNGTHRVREALVMNPVSRLSAIICGMLLAVLSGAAVAAVAQRTFVSTGGNDGNACSIAAPCRSFGAAIVQTLDKGEVVVLDSGGYGPVVINKSIEIIAPPGIYAGITAGVGTGIQIVSPAVNVAIRGVAINGLGTGQFGIDVQFGGTITIDRCRIANFTQDGLRFTSASRLVLQDSDLRDNGNNGLTITTGDHNTIERTTFRHNTNNGADVSGGANVYFTDSIFARNSGDGIRMSDTTQVTVTGGEVVGNVKEGVHLDGNIAGAWTRVAIDRVNISNNGQAGVFARAYSNNAIVQLAVARCLFVENFSGVTGATFASGAIARLFVTDSVFERNANSGISIDGTAAELTIASNVVTGSNLGISKVSGATIFTRGNTTDTSGGAFTSLPGV